MEIDPETLQTYTAPQIVAHCLWEMAFHGFEQAQIRAERDEIKRRFTELDAMTEEELKERTIPWERIKRLLGDDEQK